MRSAEPLHLGPYDLRRQLGRGGMGVVYRAVHRDLGRACAVKVLPPERAGRPGLRSRWRREAKMHARFEHPNLPRIFDVGQDGGHDYLAMELVDGCTLDEFLAVRGPLELAEALWVGRELLAALAHVHAHGVIHRDVKPCNVMSSIEGGLKLMDFGLALSLDDTRLTETGQIVGTLCYVPPEVLTGESPGDQRSDLFQWAATLCECLLGASLWAKHPRGLGVRAGAPLHPLPWWGRLAAIAPDQLLRLLERCLAERPVDRYPDVPALQADFLPLCAAGGAGPGRLGPRSNATAPSRPAPAVEATPGTAPGTSRRSVLGTAVLLCASAALLMGSLVVRPGAATPATLRRPAPSPARELDMLVHALLDAPGQPAQADARRVADLAGRARAAEGAHPGCPVNAAATVRATTGEAWPPEAAGLLELAWAAERSARPGRAAQLYGLLASRHGARDLGHGLVMMTAPWLTAARDGGGPSAVVASLRSALDASPDARQRTIYGAALVSAVIAEVEAAAPTTVGAPALANLAGQLRPLVGRVVEPGGLRTVFPAYLRLLGALGTEDARQACDELADLALERLGRREDAEFYAGYVLPECARTLLVEGTPSRAEALLRAALPRIAHGARRASAAVSLAKVLSRRSGGLREAGELLRGLEPAVLHAEERWRYFEACAVLHEAQLELREAAAAFADAAALAPPGTAARLGRRSDFIRLAAAVGSPPRRQS